MSFADWLTDSWGEALRNHSIAETFQDVQTFAGDLAQLCAQDHEALESALGDMPLATTQREDVLAAIKAGEDFKKQYE